MKVLFIGNSHTFVHYVPAWIQAFCKSHGQSIEPVMLTHPEEELFFADGEHSSILGASLSAAVIGRTLLGREIAPEECYIDAKQLERMPFDPRMIDLVMQDGELKMA